MCFVDDDGCGIFVSAVAVCDVAEFSMAERNGFRQGDIFVNFDERSNNKDQMEFLSMNDIKSIIIGPSCMIDVWRYEEKEVDDESMSECSLECAIDHDSKGKLERSEGFLKSLNSDLLLKKYALIKRSCQNRYGWESKVTDSTFYMYIQFMMLKAERHDQFSRIFCPPYKLVDCMWREHILHMSHYHEFCTSLTEAYAWESPGLLYYYDVENVDDSLMRPDDSKREFTLECLKKLCAVKHQEASCLDKDKTLQVRSKQTSNEINKSKNEDIVKDSKVIEFRVHLPSRPNSSQDTQIIRMSKFSTVAALKAKLFSLTSIQPECMFLDLATKSSGSYEDDDTLERSGISNGSEVYLYLAAAEC